MSGKSAAQAAWRLAASAGILGWVLDAFDFFVIVFLFDALAQHFHVSKASIVFTLTMTLAMRPVGAILFGMLADTVGRRRPLIVCVLYFSLCTVLSGVAPNYTMFVVCRALYGIGMGGYWGIGASYAIESAPARLQGNALRADPGRLSRRLSAGRGRHADAGSRTGLEVGVLCGSAGSDRDRDSDLAGSGVTGMEAASSRVPRRGLCLACSEPKDVSLPAANDDRADLSLAWFAGFVS